MILIENNLDIMVGKEISIREALKKIDRNREGIVFVVDLEQRLLGTITDGDIRRTLLSGKNLSESIEGIYNTSPYSFSLKNYSDEYAKKILVENGFGIVPITNEEEKVVGYVTWNQLLSGVSRKVTGRAVSVPVVIMAGGKGTRMAPFTNVLPKPLIPIGDKTVLEVIIDNFLRFDIKNFYFTINYRGEMIRSYFDYIEKDYTIRYLKETSFFGTAGSLSLLPPEIGQTFIVSNCDIIVDTDYADILDFHRKTASFLTVVSSIQHHQVPYGVISFEPGGRVTTIEEKPEFSYCINTGVYFLEKECLEYIPADVEFHMTHLIERLIKDGKVVSTYPVNESDYIDIGQWEEYHKAVGLLSKTM